MRFPPRRWGHAVIWLASNGLGCLVVAAVIAWVNPQPIRWDVAAPPLQPVMTRNIQLAPCPPWALDMGRWESANVCGVYPGAEARYRRFLKNT